MHYDNKTNDLSQQDKRLMTTKTLSEKYKSFITARQTHFHNKTNTRALSQQDKRSITTRQTLYHNKTNALSQQDKRLITTK